VKNTCVFKSRVLFGSDVVKGMIMRSLIGGNGY
jgi:hypothetical protein